MTPELQGYRLVDGKYERQPLMESLDGRLALRSETLVLDLWVKGREMRFRDPGTGLNLLSHREEHATTQAGSQSHAKPRKRGPSGKPSHAKLRKRGLRSWRRSSAGSMAEQFTPGLSPPHRPAEGFAAGRKNPVGERMPDCCINRPVMPAEAEIQGLP